MLRAFHRGRGQRMPPLTLPELKLLALYSREEEREHGSRIPFMAALEELNTLAGIVLAESESAA